MSPKNYGRQAKDKTIKSISIERDLADWIQEKADEKGVSFSSFINDYFREKSHVDEVNKTVSFPLPFYGAAAAGEQVSSQLEGETVQVAKEYPSGYFVVEVNGQSMEPTLQDGSRIVCEPKEFSPANGKVYVVSDGQGSSVKRYDGKKKAFVSDNKNFPDLTPVGEVKIQGLYVETIPA